MPADEPRLARLRAAFPVRPANGPPRRVAIVGNAPGEADEAAAIDAADVVVRFNRPLGWGGPRGQRLTQLWLVTAGGAMREWLADPGFARRDEILAARLVVLAIDPASGSDDSADGWNGAAAAAERLAPAADLAMLPAHDFAATKAELRRLSGREELAPSTGFLATRRLVGEWRPGDPPVMLHGFGFEGWSGHAFAAERAWCEARAAEGRLRIAAPG